MKFPFFLVIACALCALGLLPALQAQVAPVLPAVAESGDDVTKPIFGPALFSVDMLLGYAARPRIIGGHKFGWRVQLNVRNLLDDDALEPIRASLDGGVLDWGRTPPRQIVLNTTFTF